MNSVIFCQFGVISVYDLMRSHLYSVTMPVRSLLLCMIFTRNANLDAR